MITKIKAQSSFFLMLIAILGVVSISLAQTISISTFNISHYVFGKITINGHTYSNDIVLWPNGEIKPGPADMHALGIKDFEDFLNSGHKKLVISTGMESKVTSDFGRKLKKELKDRGIEIQLINTHDVVKLLNETAKPDFVVFFHLTC